jgi:hypothetical protein
VLRNSKPAGANPGLGVTALAITSHRPASLKHAHAASASQCSRLGDREPPSALAARTARSPSASCITDIF